MSILSVSYNSCSFNVFFLVGKFIEAREEHEQELGICEALNDSIGAAVACRKIGENYCDLQEYEKALQFQQRHLNLAKKCGSLIEEQRALATIGMK